MKVLVFYSGGKDSQAALIWAVKTYGVKWVEAVFCDTGWENKQTYEHIRSTTEQLGVELVTLKSKKYDGMLDLAIKKKRFPSTMARYCTDELKVRPAIDYVLSKNENLIIIEGIRKNESLSRAKMDKYCTYFRYYFEKQANGKTHTYRKKDVVKWCGKYNADKVRPVFDWSADEVINYIKDSGQLPNPLYYQGFKRVGCFPCIMCNHSEIRLLIDNFPERIDELRKAEGKVGTNFFPPNYIPSRFCKNKKYPFIEDVEKYIKNKNATADMFYDQGQTGCISVYNLCE